jgi:ureidoglycolate lyase
MAVLAIRVEALTAEAFAPFGAVLGSPFPGDRPEAAFGTQASDFWHAHDFDTGTGGQPEVLWVRYRNDSLRVNALEAHWLTEQAVVPLGGRDVVQVVCPTRADGGRAPDLARARAFLVASGQGICMKPGCWHASLVTGGETTCLMLTRRSTTLDLVAHLKGEPAAGETSIVATASQGVAELVVEVSMRR